MSDESSATPRDFLAVERTFLAWIRTGLALMGLGFVLARFGIFLREFNLNQVNLPSQSFGLSLWFRYRADFSCCVRLPVIACPLSPAAAAASAARSLALEPLGAGHHRRSGPRRPWRGHGRLSDFRATPRAE